MSENFLGNRDSCRKPVDLVQNEVTYHKLGLSLNFKSQKDPKIVESFHPKRDTYVLLIFKLGKGDLLSVTS